MPARAPQALLGEAEIAMGERASAGAPSSRAGQQGWTKALTKDLHLPWSSAAFVRVVRTGTTVPEAVTSHDIAGLVIHGWTS